MTRPRADRRPAWALRRWRTRRPLRSSEHTSARHAATRRAALALALALAPALGCAGPPAAPDPVWGEGGAPQVLLLPLNVPSPMAVGLAPYEEPVWQELEAFLRGQGHTLKTLSPRTARALWLESIAEVKAGGRPAASGFDAAAGVLARRVREHAPFDAMVVPSLFVREATIAERSARWDGVERRMRFALRGVDARRLAERPLEGVVPAASLHVAIFDDGGVALHEGLGGLEVMVEIRVTGSNLSGEPTFQLSDRTDLAEDRSLVREAVSEAFAPADAPRAE